VSRRGPGWQEWGDAQARAIRAAGQWRAPVDFDAAGPEGKLAPEGRAVIAFASNDYLGLTQHPDVVAAAHAALDRWGTGSGAARLIVGSRPIHSELEQELAAWKSTDAAVLFPTGFAANLGVLTTFGGPGTFLCSDELNHASIIDGTRLARGEVAVYPHRDLAALDALLDDRTEGRRALVVSDSVFSMDGDLADVDGLMEICAHHGALLVLDEAHAVLGPEIEAPGPGLLRIGTLSKTLGALGGFVAGPHTLTDLVVNRARSYIFTTATSPADAAAALAALHVVRGPEGDELRARLRSNVAELRPGHPSPIVPVVCGDEARSLAAAAALLELGLLVPAIRPPTVPVGTSRLRVALSAAHTVEQVSVLRGALERLGLA
jgi:8-amino-7-oxononanoate synthase